ncbi:MAG: hypothetical protein ACKKL6_04180 [Candidatus Komeilibacteria bacterium]
MNLGILIILITILGCFSNWLNGKFLNFRITHWLYYLGALIHELSHAILCVLTGARISEFKVFSKQPHVTHSRPRLILIGQPLISLAPIAGGLLFIYIINTWLLNNYINVINPTALQEIPRLLINIFSQLNLAEWQTWIIILLFINVGAMIGPSTKDLKNIWPFIIVMFFINWPLLTNLSIVAIYMIIINIIIQIIAILIKQFFRFIPS